jgi:hypothetical protein
MERTLANVLGQRVERERPTRITKEELKCTVGFNSYLTVFSIQLVHRFPVVTDLTGIPYDEVQKIADFSAASSLIALETWGRVTEEQYKQQAA